MLFDEKHFRLNNILIGVNSGFSKLKVLAIVDVSVVDVFGVVVLQDLTSLDTPSACNIEID